MARNPGSVDHAACWTDSTGAENSKYLGNYVAIHDAPDVLFASSVDLRSLMWATSSCSVSGR